ncbi:acyl-CoA dehydratase activase [Clostridium saccharobutylicum]|uniref:CoA-substrate-specific enzyme activase n=1 Tax=Clostridium saccharobutylicum DSM 13864 TaxID=1345695 RepID=U5MT34_CLOSA|nr:acyl-CoA dehydratase activase [Clostridium saccharobutylicum]AGX42826.1 CoA-substrate-specific enzyme activase [Clostridium saccharobutylicum DSM 13864]AQR90122.1 R-phenyllactate dehydratase activator [Clostridium saccharobutylicum]AQS00028.1 R-phenyllactate dehydratase activator [Clostridium saccharobutylicum]AQS09814.1 R-phenyllactate dehydratase activator [Clostridium saccharobutylicum]AQS14011.1 R-phenyllactate dehydratase activator [Clostridium saccharobutylicum]
MNKYTLGIDSGSTTTKGVLFDGKNIVKTMIVKTSAKPKESIYKIYNELYSDDVGYTIATGYGRNLLKEANKTVTEITCHAQGAAFLNPTIRGVIDIGGQDSKVILLDNSLNVIDFLMNDKCAAGTGRFVDVMMRTLEEDMSNIDDFVKDRNPVTISSMCTVFAESEIISLLAKDVHRGDIALGIIHSICKRTANFAQRLSLQGDIFFSGGLALSEVFRANLEVYLNRKVITNDLCQFAGAIGAATIAYRKIKAR